MTITEFLLARIAEDEAVARAALAPDQMHSYGDLKLPRARPDEVPDQMRGYLGGTWGEHAARWDMTRALAECEAKRLLIAAAFDNAATIDGEWGCCHSAGEIRAGECHRTEAADLTELRILARVYADHPDFDGAWAE